MCRHRPFPVLAEPNGRGGLRTRQGRCPNPSRNPPKSAGKPYWKRRIRYRLGCSSDPPTFNGVKSSRARSVRERFCVKMHPRPSTSAQLPEETSPAASRSQPPISSRPPTGDSFRRCSSPGHAPSPSQSTRRRAHRAWCCPATAWMSCSPRILAGRLAISLAKPLPKRS